MSTQSRPVDTDGRALWAVLGLALGGAELLALSGIAPAPHTALLGLRFLEDPSLAAGLAAALVSLLWLPPRRAAAAAVLVVLSSFAGQLTAALHPTVWDVVVARAEAVGRVSLDLAIARARHSAAVALLPGVGAMACVLAALPRAQWRSRRGARFLEVLLLAVAVAFVVENVLPTVGRRDLADGVLAPAGAESVVGPISAPPQPRTATLPVPALWALLAWGQARDQGLRRRRLVGTLAAVTIGSLLVSGQAYLASVIVAWTAGAAARAASLALRAKTDVPSVPLAVALAALGTWIGLVRSPASGAASFPVVAWLLLAVSAAAAALAARRLPAPAEGPSADSPADGPGFSQVGVIFFISGFAGLIYEVVFGKALALTFGSMARATQTVLAVYMAGMAIGAWAGGRLAARHRDALRLYAWCELGIGAFSALTPLIFRGGKQVYVWLARGVDPASGSLVALQVALGAALLFIPTTLMGMTLPLLTRHVTGRGEGLGRGVALLYGFNTVGAAAGALCAGYVILPHLGVRATTMLAVVANLGAALWALHLQKGPAAAGPEDASADEAIVAAPAATAGQWLPFVVLGVGGFGTLALEVICVHLLAVVAGNSAYAFSLMLFAFLLGLGAGAAVVHRWLRPGRPLETALALSELALAAVVLAEVFLWDDIPGYFGAFGSYPLVQTFGAREAVRGLVCCLTMVPPAFFIGAAYPLAMEWLTRFRPGRRFRAMGEGVALNTAGNILGALGAGFVLLPRLGPLASLHLVAASALVLGLAVSLRASGAARRASLAAVPVLVLFALQPKSFDYEKLASGANVYFRPVFQGRVIDQAESLDGGLTSVIENDLGNGRAMRTLLTNGKFQGNDGVELTAQYAIAVCPLLHSPARGRALVVGFGTGTTARVIHDSGFAQIDVVDLSADILRLADSYFRSVNGGVLARPGVRVHVTDGANFVLIEDERYDLISMEVSSIWFAGASALYNREFYAMARKRLTETGVLQQWVQLHHLSPLDILSILATMRSEFRNVWLYVLGGQGVAVGCNHDCRPSPESLSRLEGTATLSNVWPALGGSPRRVLEARLLTPEGIDRLLQASRMTAGQLLSTNDNLRLEYSTPRGNVEDAGASYQRNLRMLSLFAAASPFEATALAAPGEASP